jgi:protein TonB
MFARIAGSVLVGIILSLLIFLAMQTMISPSRTEDTQLDPYPTIDFVRLVREEPPPLPKKRILPEHPQNPPPTENTPSPRLTLSAPRRPDISAPQIKISTNKIAPLQLLDMAPLPGPPAILDTGADIELVPLVRVPPRYPRRAARRQVEGFVKVEFTIAKDGSVQNPTVIDSAPSQIFDQAALQAIVQWKFKPRTRAGKPVASRASQRIDFALKGR